jgi:hypothetical protein
VFENLYGSVIHLETELTKQNPFFMQPESMGLKVSRVKQKLGTPKL